jgi:hypothetical protein
MTEASTAVINNDGYLLEHTIKCTFCSKLHKKVFISCSSVHFILEKLTKCEGTHANENNKYMSNFLLFCMCKAADGNYQLLITSFAFQKNVQHLFSGHVMFK